MKRHLPLVDMGPSLDDLLAGTPTDSSLSEKIDFVDTRPAPLVVTKETISYSELVTWLDCAWRHKLKYIDAITLDGPSEHTEFGQVMHDVLEEFVKTGSMPSVEVARGMLTERFSCLPRGAEMPPREWHDTMEPMMNEMPTFMAENFPGWTKLVEPEFELMEPIDGQTRKFKGFVDLVIQVPKQARKGSKNVPDGHIVHVLDYKTTSWGWALEKKIDPKKTLQLALYKHFLSKKLNIDPKDIRCGFILLKRTAKKEKCELVTVSVGDVAIDRALGSLHQMLGYVKKGFYPKNRDSCRFCVYKGTVHCP